MSLFTDPRRGPLRPGRLFAIVLGSVFSIETALMLVLPELLPDRHRDLVMVLADGLVLTAVLAPILWMAVIRPLEELVVIRTALLQRVLTIQEDERGRVAREMHDGLGQSLTSMLVGLRAVEELTNEQAVRRHLEELRRIASSTHDEVRRMARGLRPSALDDVGLFAALERFCQDVFAATAGKVEVCVEGSADTESIRIDPAVETACFRIVQEATANAIRHGGARLIRVTLARHASNLELAINDNGRGAASPAAMDGDAGESASLGLWSVRERVALLSGTVETRSRPGQGLSLLCRIPLQERKDESLHGENPSTRRR